MHAPYDVLRPLRCRATVESKGGGREECGLRAQDINWNQPDIHGFRCKRCKTPNVVVVVASPCPECNHCRSQYTEGVHAQQAPDDRDADRS